MTNEERQKGCGIFLISGPLWLYLTWAEAFVMTNLWAWHIVPLGARTVPLGAFAAGLLMWTLLRIRRVPREDKRSDGEKAAALLISLGAPWIALGIGWVLT